MTDEQPTNEFLTDEHHEDEYPADETQLTPPVEDGLAESSAAPTKVVERFKKRRVVIGTAFLVLGLAGAVSDLFDIDGGTALAIAGLVGSVALLGTLVVGAQHNARLFNQAEAL